MASLNAIATGRVICGIGTGNTARGRADPDERVAALGKAGIDEVVIQPVVDPEREMREPAELMG